MWDTTPVTAPIIVCLNAPYIKPEVKGTLMVFTALPMTRWLPDRHKEANNSDMCFMVDSGARYSTIAKFSHRFRGNL